MSLLKIKITAVCFFAAAVFSITGTVQGATLSVSPSSNTYNVGDTFTVSIILDTEGQAVDGVDIKNLNYDPSLLEVLDANASQAGVQISPGTIMPVNSANSVDTVNGKVVFSQVASGHGSKFNGSGVLATLDFKALSPGTASVSIDFTQGSGIDTNVAALRGTDVLSGVFGGSYTITQPIADSDGDGVPDADDQCPGTPAGVQVDGTGCPTGGQTGTVNSISINIHIENNDNFGGVVDIEIRNAGTKTVVLKRTITPTAGATTLSVSSIAIPAGVYDIKIKAKHHLSKVIRNISLNDGAVITPTGEFSAGDANDDGVVDLNDKDLLRARWGSGDAATDFNGDGRVNAVDWSLMHKHWGELDDD